MMLAALLIIGGLALALLYGLALCRAARQDDETGRPTQISHRWVIQPPRWTVWAPTRQTVAIRPRRRRR
ncbi:hypothetical protein KXS07_17745 [Inquilinus limosus]|uniref:hypothetical protein n=1 Tax=Inquilinus limosus TaxID=171674 RepID=UPI003F166A29